MSCEITSILENRPAPHKSYRKAVFSLAPEPLSAPVIYGVNVFIRDPITSRLKLLAKNPDHFVAVVLFNGVKCPIHDVALPFRSWRRQRGIQVVIY
jgi:hypothetical protein